MRQHKIQRGVEQRYGKSQKKASNRSPGNKNSFGQL
jgi:hypothetical protein